MRLIGCHLDRDGPMVGRTGGTGQIYRDYPYWCFPIEHTQVIHHPRLCIYLV